MCRACSAAEGVGGTRVSTVLQAPVSDLNLAATYGHLLDLDRAGWAWEWLRRNPDFIAIKPEIGRRITTPCALVVETDEAWERRLLRWGLHYG